MNNFERRLGVRSVSHLFLCGMVAALLAFPAHALTRASTVQEWLQTDEAEQISLVEMYLLSVRFSTPEDINNYGPAIWGNQVFAIREGRISAAQMTRLMKQRPPKTSADLNRPVSEHFVNMLSTFQKVPDKQPERERLTPLSLPEPEGALVAGTMADAAEDAAQDGDTSAFGLWWHYMLLGLAAILIGWVVLRRKKSPPEIPEFSGKKPKARLETSAEPIPGLRAIIADIQAAETAETKS